MELGLKGVIEGIEVYIAECERRAELGRRAIQLLLETKPSEGDSTPISPVDSGPVTIEPEARTEPSRSTEPKSASPRVIIDY